MFSASIGTEAHGLLVLAAIPIWLPVALVAVFVVAAVAYEITLARRILRAPDTDEAVAAGEAEAAAPGEEPTESDTAEAVEVAEVAEERTIESEAQATEGSERAEEPVTAETGAEGQEEVTPEPAEAEAVAPEEAVDATTRLAVSETVRSVLTQLGDRRLDHDEVERLTVAVSQEVARSVGATSGLDATHRDRLEETLRLEVGRQLTGETAADESLSVSGVNAGH